MIAGLLGAVSHRGPNGRGAVFGTGADVVDQPQNGADWALGHVRLAILDLSDAGLQPMSRGQAWITYNGEVYNYVELRRELEGFGHRFETETDTEVILHAYDRWGEDCVGRFNGMWAFAIWDRRRRKLFCARDRFGIKPFFYTERRGLFAFASEIKALISLSDVPTSPNAAIIHDYLTLKLSDHTDETFYEEVRRLPAAHRMSVDAEGRVRVERYWDLAPNEAIEWSQSDAEEGARRFYDLLRDSIRLRLRSDVKIGTCLSGGLDSSAIVMLANSLMFDEKAYPIPAYVSTPRRIVTRRVSDE